MSRLGYGELDKSTTVKAAVREVSKSRFGVVAIGRNEGQRLRRCLESVRAGSVVIYVDSGSIDGSSQMARDCGAIVVDLDMELPFTAARARNAGFKSLVETAPDVDCVQFIDGDCELINRWPEQALSFLGARPEIAAVSGRRRERFPNRSIYNQLCDWEWNGPTGEVRACGGDVMIRVSAFKIVGGYRETLIAGEEPELCVRLRAAGWKIWRLEDDMTIHDAAMTHFGQWWRRAVRGGYAFAQGVDLHGGFPERHWVWESRRAWLWGILLPIGCAAIGLLFGGWTWALWLIYPAQVVRLTARTCAPFRQRVLLSLFQVLARFAEGYGQLKFLFDRVKGRQGALIEYK
jgi:glycosyltransferase involved in cell wall biosynthesis